MRREKFIRWFEKSLVSLANIFVYAYLLDSLITILDVGLDFSFDVDLLKTIRYVVSMAVLFIAVLWIPVVLFIQKVPGWFLLFLALGTLWVNTAAMPLRLLFVTDELLWEFFPALVQLAIGVLCLLNVRRISGHWWIGVEFLDPKPWKFFRWLRHWIPPFLLLSFTVILYVGLFIIFGVYIVTRSFIFPGLDGIYQRDVEYQSPEGQLVRLVAMTRVGKETVYEELMRSFTGPSTIILEEKISDNLGLFSVREYEPTKLIRLGKGLVRQPPLTFYLEDERDVTIRNADIDFSEFSPEAIEWLKDTKQDFDPPGCGANSLDWAVFVVSELELEKINPSNWSELVTRRNNSLLNHFDAVVGEFDSIVIPWGAAHMPELSDALFARGYQTTRRSQDRLILGWGSLLAVLGGNYPEDSRYYDQETLELIATKATSAMYETRKQGLSLTTTLEGTSDLEPDNDSFYGGLPSRFEGEQWPLSPVTQRPLNFVAEIARNSRNETYMGRIKLLRVFVDYERFEGANDQDNFQILITMVDDPAQDEVGWRPETLTNLEKQFGEDSVYGTKFRSPRYEITSRRGTFVNSALMPEVPEKLLYDCLSQWFDIKDAAESVLVDEHPELIRYSIEGVIGGHPSWVQNEEKQSLPFFMQLYPPKELMWGDGGVIYLFLDKNNPKSGFVLLGQMS